MRHYLKHLRFVMLFLALLTCTWRLKGVMVATLYLRPSKPVQGTLEVPLCPKHSDLVEKARTTVL